MKKIAAWMACVWILGIAVTPAWGDAAIMKKGDVAPSDGIFIPAKDAVDAGDMLDRYLLLEQRIAAMQADLDAKVELISILEKQLGSSERELALKDLIIQHKDEMLAFRKEMNDEYKALLKEVRDSMTHDKSTIERLEKQAEAANKRTIWGSVIAFILGAAVAFFSHGVLH